MRIKVYVDWRKPSKDGKMPVCISVNYKGERFFIRTGLFTTERFSGETFPKSQSNHDKKSRILGKMLIDTESYIILNQHLSSKEMKESLKRDILYDTIIKPCCPTLAEIVEKYSQNLENGGTREIYQRTIVRIDCFDRHATVDSVDASWLNDFKKSLLNVNLRYSRKRQFIFF